MRRCVLHMHVLMETRKEAVVVAVDDEFVWRGKLAQNSVSFSTEGVWTQAGNVSLNGCKNVVAVGNDAAKGTCLIVSASIRALNEGFAFVDVVVKSFFVVNGMVL